MDFKLTLDFKKTLLGIVLSVTAFSVLLYAMATLLYADSLRVRERDGFCPTGTWAQNREGAVIPGHTVILVDTSNKIIEQDGNNALEAIEKWAREEVDFLHKVSLYGLPETEHEVPMKIGQSWCIPKQGVMADVLYENPRYVELEFRGVFLASLRKTFNSLLEQEEAPQSPIVETLSYLVGAHDDLTAIILVSDMMQHSSLVSHYDENHINISETEECQDVKLKSLHVRYISRGIKQQPMDWKINWGGCFGNVENFTSLEL